jgi:hypothetical protein
MIAGALAPTPSVTVKTPSKSYYFYHWQNDGGWPPSPTLRYVGLSGLLPGGKVRVRLHSIYMDYAGPLTGVYLECPTASYDGSEPLITDMQTGSFIPPMLGFFHSSPGGGPVYAMGDHFPPVTLQVPSQSIELGLSFRDFQSLIPFDPAGVPFTPSKTCAILEVTWSE